MDAQLAALREAIELACQCQGSAQILRGRSLIAAMPRSWLSENIITAAESQLNLEDDEWEYRRLLEVCALNDLHQVASELIRRGLSSSNEEIREAATDYDPNWLR
jgi:hypothetical protein